MPDNALSLFLSRAMANPGAIAVTGDGSKRTYAELDAESAGYAAELARLGAGRETVVAVVAQRSPQLVAMLLAVLRAGAAYLPVEPGTPADRARRICTTAATPVLMTHPDHADYAADLVSAFPPGQAPLILPVVTGRGGGARSAGPALREPSGLAYVIFTSGSTGVPKGAMVTDGGMANHIAAKTADLGLTATDVIGFTAPLSFDISVWQAVTALTVGGTVAVASPANLSEPDELLGWVNRHQVTVLEIVPSYLAVVLELQSPAALRSSLRSLRFLMATGEALPSRLAERWYERCPDIPLINAYGPTECSDDVTHHIVTPADCSAAAWPPIGTEVLNTRIYVTDPQGRPLPDGTEGELLVGGAGVGRGYLRDPVRTALSFIPDHLSGAAGARLYRTGDRGRRGPGGVLHYVGRRDRQVKIRGHRIELGDVEAQLLRVPLVASAACVAAGGQLHAFVTLKPDAAGHDAADQIRAQLQPIAPPYLVPQNLSVVDQLPANASGKVDYRALERRAAAGAQGHGRAGQDAAASEPAGRAEPTSRAEPGADGATLDQVTSAAAEILGGGLTGPDDDFFASGGDSLLAMALVSLARKRFGAPNLLLRDFLASPTPRGLFTALQAARTAPRRDEPELAPGALSSGQERLWFIEQLNRGKDPLLIHLELTLRGRLDIQALQHALDAVATRHEPMRTVFSQRGGVPVATIWPRVTVPIETSASADPAPEAGGLSARTERPPLVRAGLARIAPDHHILTLVLHHLVADGWSLAVLRQELATYYQRWVDGNTEVPLPGTSFSQYVGEERRWLNGDEARECERYWKDQLTGAPAEIELPLRQSRPAKRDFRTGCVVRELTGDETSALAHVVRSANATPFMAVMTAFYAVLRGITGTADLVIGIDSVNRSWPGSEELIGTFVNQLPVRLQAQHADCAFGDLLALVRHQLLGAYEHDRLPFHKIVAAVNPPRKSGRFPLYQVKLTHQSAWRIGVTLQDLEVLPRLIPDRVMDPDLMLDMSGEADVLRLEMLYLPELLAADTAAAWLDAVCAVLRRAIADPAAQVLPGPAARADQDAMAAETGQSTRGSAR